MYERVEQILREFASHSLDIEGAILISSQGQPITVAVGIEHNSALILAGMMLRLAAQVDEEFQWNETEQVSIRAREGYITLISCNPEVFLLVKTARVPWGLLDRGIHRTIETLQTELQLSNIISSSADTASQIALPASNGQITASARSQSKTSLDGEFIKYCQQELAQYIGPISSVICKRILSKNPQMERIEFIKALTKYISQPQQATEFQSRLQKREWGIGHPEYQ